MRDQGTPTIKDADNLLKQRFGHDEFRPGQRRVIEHILATAANPSSPDVPSDKTGRALAVFPTGAGKSLCYQLPGLLFNDGLTLIVSPLMALMKDQTDTMVRKGFSAACLDSSLTASETRELFQRVQDEDLRILFVSPERFKNSRFLRLIQRTRISLFAVDEAHCISEWGHSFRPDYLRLSRWAERLNCQRRLALTATATPRVAEDICAALDIPFPSAQVRLPSVRRNLTLRVSSVPSALHNGNQTLTQKLETRINILADRITSRDPGPTIIYVTLQATATFVATELRKRGMIQAAAYHAGMKQDDRKQVQESFMENKKDAIVVATIAFGMGMDHSGIRYVYHFNMPKSLEGYIQEIGRAGRDGMPAICETLACVDDLPTLEGFAYAETPALSSVRALLHHLLGETKEGESIEYSTYTLCYDFDIRDTSLGQILAQLDLAEDLLEESTPFFSEQTCRLPPATTRKAPPPGSEARKVWDLGKIGRTNMSIDVTIVAKELGLEYGRISRICDDMANDGYLESVRSSKLMHRALIKSQPHDLDAISKRMHAMLLRTQKQQLKRIRQVVDYLSADECQSAYIQRHLGDEVKSGRCGHCEFCLNAGVQPVKISEDVRERAGKVLDVRRWALIQQEVALPRNNALLMARFAAGISSPVISRKYRKLAKFGSMSDHAFTTLLDAAEQECSET